MTNELIIGTAVFWGLVFSAIWVTGRLVDCIKKKRRKKMKKRIIFMLMFLVTVSLAFGEIHSWNSGTVKYSVSDRFILAGNGEIRFTGPDFYYSHIHFDLDYRLNKNFTIGVSERESYLYDKSKVEHKPMVNFKAKFGALKNRARVTWRIKEGANVVRFRNKTTATFGDAFVAYELFLEEGEKGIFRSRYYCGAYIAKGLSVFLLRQYTRGLPGEAGAGIWIIGTSWSTQLFPPRVKEEPVRARWVVR